MSIGKTIRKYRKEKGLTQNELAKFAGVNEVTIRSYEAEKYKPKFETLVKISDALGVHVGDLIENWNEYTDKPRQASALDLFVVPPMLPPKEQYRRKVYIKEYEIIEKYRSLNECGQSKALEQLEMLTKIPEYQRTKSDQEDGNADEQPDK